jgi:hypothetical protein
MRDHLLEIEALLVRKEGVAKLIGEEDGMTLLALIVAPSPEVREASLLVARERGVSELAHKVERDLRREKARAKKLTPPKVVRTRPRSRVRKRVLTIDEILARA